MLLSNILTPRYRAVLRPWIRSRALGLLILGLAVFPQLLARSDDATDATDATTADPLASYYHTLEAADIKPTAEGILAHLAVLAPTEAVLKQMDNLVRQLGSNAFAERKKAQSQLTALGILAESRVKEATKSEDPEIAERAQDVLKQWSTSSADTVLQACFRLLAALKPAKAVPAVLGVLPLCAKPYLGSMAEEALLTLAKTNDLPALKQVLDKGCTQERCLVVTVYASLLGTNRTVEIDPLLAAKAPQLRLAAARALANLGLYKAAGTFVDLLEHDDVEIRAASFNYLLQFTKQDFKFSAYGPEAQRQASVAAWRQWLAGDGKTAALTFPLKFCGSISHLPAGHTLIAMGNNQRGAVEFDADGKEVWSCPFQNCWTAERLANGNTLLSSHTAGISEVTPDKKTVWEYAGSWIRVVPLENGNILAVSQAQQNVVEIRKQDKAVVWDYKVEGMPVSAIRLPNGNTIIGATGGTGLMEVTPEKKIIWTLPGLQSPYGLQFLPNGNLLITDFNGPKRRVFEWNRKAERAVWEYKEDGCIDAYRTAEGNTLITTANGVLEVTPENKIVRRWSGNSYGAARR